MIGNLGQALSTLLTEALPGLFGGGSPSVLLTVEPGLLEVDPTSADAIAGEPRPDDRTDNFPFDPAHPTGPFTLTQPPYSGPRRVYLRIGSDGRIPTQRNEVEWDPVDPRQLTLNLRPNRDLTAINGVVVLYGVTAVFTKLKARQGLNVQLQSSDAAGGRLEEAEALVTAVIILNRQQLVDASRATFENGDYGAGVEIKSLTLVSSSGPSNDIRLLTLQVDIELKATRALQEDEGKPIERILTPGRPLDPDRHVDIAVEVEA